jgi:hypothetical protein
MNSIFLLIEFKLNTIIEFNYSRELVLNNFISFITYTRLEN